MTPEERLASLRQIPEDQQRPRSIEDRWAADEQAMARGLIQVESEEPGISAEQAKHEPAVELGRTATGRRAAWRHQRGRTRRSRVGPLTRRADHQTAPGLRTRPQNAGVGAHRRTTRRQPAVDHRAGTYRGCPEPAAAARVPAHNRCWPTRPTAAQPTGPIYAAGESGVSSRSRPTRPPTAATAAVMVGGHRRSTRSPTGSATPWSVASTYSNNTVPWPPATTNSPYGTKPPPPSA